MDNCRDLIYIWAVCEETRTCGSRRDLWYDLLANSYETVYILKPDLSEEATLDTIKKYQQLLYNNKAGDISVYDRGRRHLSYPIRKYHDGIYVQMNYKANSQVLSVLEKFLKIDENIIRYLTTKQFQETFRTQTVAG